jgi:hypothetical protein
MADVLLEVLRVQEKIINQMVFLVYTHSEMYPRGSFSIKFSLSCLLKMHRMKGVRNTTLGQEDGSSGTVPTYQVWLSSPAPPKKIKSNARIK